MTAGVNTSFVNVIVDVMGSLAERLSTVSMALIRQLPHLRSDDIGSRCRRERHAQGGCTEGLLGVESAMVATFSVEINSPRRRYLVRNTTVD